MKGQRKAVLEHLQNNESLTSMEAFSLYGATRLASIIFDFRKMGYNIITETRCGKTRYGSSTSYAVYKLIGKEEV